MKNLIQTHSVSYAEGVVIALEAEGIEAVLLDAGSPGYLGFAGRVRVAIENDDDLERALAVVRSIEPPKTKALPSWKLQKLGIIIGLVGLVLMFVSGSMIEPGEANPLGRALFWTAAALMIAGIGLVMLGPLADK